MRKVLMVASLLALVWLLLAAVLFFADAIPLERAKLQLLLATVLWFVVTPLWMGRSGGAGGKRTQGTHSGPGVVGSSA